MINLDIEKKIFDKNIIDLNAELFVKKTLIRFVFEINSNDIDTEKALTKQNITILV